MNIQKTSFWRKLPTFIRVILLIISIVTVVYWVFYLVYHIIDILRAIIHFLTEKSHWWIFMLCILICCIVALLFAQFYFNLDPIGNAWNWILEKINFVRNWLAELIKGAE